jgi:predicted lactoylglutathione lyase
MSFGGDAGLRLQIPVAPEEAQMTTPTPAYPSRVLFISLPVRDPQRSKAFFEKLGFSFNPSMSDETTACMVIGEQALVMLATHEKIAELSKLPLADPTTHALALFSFTVASRDEVDAVADAAVAAGGKDHNDAEDHGFMYSRSFFDLDGHGWQVMWFDPAATEVAQQTQAAATT